MVAPEVANFANLDALQVVIVADERVHVAVEALQVVDRSRVEFNLDEILRVGYMKVIRYISIIGVEILTETYFR